MPYSPNMSEAPRKAAESRKKRMDVAAAKKVLKQSGLTGKKRHGAATGKLIGKSVGKTGRAVGKALSKHPESRRRSRD